MERVRRWRMIGGGVYFALQGVGVGLWWLWMLWMPSVRVHFRTHRLSDTGLMDFAWPDLPLLMVGSWVCAGLLWWRSESVWTQRCVWLMVGVVLYPTLYVMGATFWTGGEGWAASMAMGAASMGTCLAAWTVRSDGALFRVAPVRLVWVHVAWTFAQTCVFWAVALWFAPWLVCKAEAALGILRFQTPAQSWLPWLLFGVVGGINLWTGYLMARCGEGTPLPLDTARFLVIRGPYRVVRNPMALTGLFLGAMVGWGVGSWGVLAMVAVGGVFWDIFVRPIEEADLIERFGEPYVSYREKVRCWLPNWPPYPPTP